MDFLLSNVNCAAKAAGLQLVTPSKTVIIKIAIMSIARFPRHRATIKYYIKTPLRGNIYLVDRCSSATCLYSTTPLGVPPLSTPWQSVQSFCVLAPLEGRARVQVPRREKTTAVR